MKYVFVLISCMLVFASGFSQPESKEYLLQKSKKQKTTAWILLGAGTAAIITGVIMNNAHKDNEGYHTGAMMEILGVSCALVSIPLFIGSSMKKKKAAALAFNYQRVQLPQNTSFATNQPTISLRISIDP